MLGTYLRNFARQHGVEKTVQFFKEGVAAHKAGKPGISPRQISLRGLAEGILGHNWARKLGRPSRFLEGPEAVDVSAFTDITGQLLVDSLYEKYNAADFVLSKMVSVEPVTTNLGPHKVPGLSKVVDDGKKVQPGMPIPQTTFDEEWKTYQGPHRRALICAVTLEMIRADLTGQAQESAENIGENLAIQKEEEIAQTMFGILNPFQWNGTTYNSFLTSGSWVNKQTGVIFTDWTALNLCEQLFYGILDPVTGRPIKIIPKDIVVMPYRYYSLKHALKATNVRTGAYPTSGENTLTDGANPLELNYNVQKSVYAYQQLTNATAIGGGGLTATQAREYVLIGDMAKAFVYREVEPLQTFVAPPQNPLEFNNDIALAVKAREWGIAQVKDPRYVVLSTNT